MRVARHRPARPPVPSGGKFSSDPGFIRRHLFARDRMATGYTGTTPWRGCSSSKGAKSGPSQPRRRPVESNNPGQAASAKPQTSLPSGRSGFGRASHRAYFFTRRDLPGRARAGVTELTAATRGGGAGSLSLRTGSPAGAGNSGRAIRSGNVSVPFSRYQRIIAVTTLWAKVAAAAPTPSAIRLSSVDWASSRRTMTALVLFMASHENPGLPQVTLQRSEHELALLTFRAPAGHGGYLKWRSNQSANR